MTEMKLFDLTKLISVLSTDFADVLKKNNIQLTSARERDSSLVSCSLLSKQNGPAKNKKDKLKFIILTPKDRTKVGTSKLITRMKSTLQMRRTYSSTTSHGASRCTTTSTILHVYSHLFVCPMHNFVLDKIQPKKRPFWFNEYVLLRYSANCSSCWRCQGCS
jgi:hypothetical protein